MQACCRSKAGELGRSWQAARGCRECRWRVIEARSCMHLCLDVDVLCPLPCCVYIVRPPTAEQCKVAEAVLFTNMANQNTTRFTVERSTASCGGRSAPLMPLISTQSPPNMQLTAASPAVRPGSPPPPPPLHPPPHPAARPPPLSPVPAACPAVGRWPAACECGRQGGAGKGGRC